MMDMLKKLFPYSFQCKGDMKKMLITVLAYLVINFVVGLVLGIFGAIPVLGLVFDLVGWIVGMYFLIAIVLVILDYFNVLKS